MKLSEHFKTESKTSTEQLPLSINIITTPEDLQKTARLFASIPEGVEVVIVISEPSSEFSEDLEHKPTDKWDTKVIKRKYEGEFNFADARNCAKHYSTRDWIMWLDSDDELIGSNISTLLKELSELPVGIGGLFCGCVGLQKEFGKNPNAYYAVAQVRLFRNLPEISWLGVAHEQIADSISKQYLSIQWSDLLIQHHGYNTDANDMRNKLKRNVRKMCAEYAQGELEDFRVNGLEDLIMRDISSIKALNI
jgi:glycosyltransferase involved in cell wall biosynthesis